MAPLAVAQNLVGQWSFEGNLLDSSGNNNNGTALGTGVGYAPGRFGQAIDFTTADAAVLIPNSPSLQTQNFTVAYWVLGSNFYSSPNLASKRFNGSGYGWQVNIINNELQACLSDANCWYSSISPSPVGNWTHVAVTYDGTTLIGYVNGIALFTEVAPGYFPGNATDDIYLGLSFVGLLDEVQIYDGALPAAQVYSLANPVPTDKNQCKNGGWQFIMRPDGTTFANQGLCIQYVNTGK